MSLRPSSNEVIPGGSYSLDVVFDNTALSGNLSLGERTTIGANVSITKPAYTNFTGAQIPPTGNFFAGFDMYLNSVGNVSADGLRSNAVSMTDIYTHNDRDSQGNLTYGPVAREGIFERVYFKIDDGAPLGYTGSFGIDSDNTTLVNGAAQEQPYQTNSNSFTVIPEPTSLFMLGSLAIGALMRRRKGRSKFK